MNTSIDSVGSSSQAATTTFTSAANETSSSSFEDILNTMLNPDSEGLINEEQMFAAIINERLITNVDENSAEEYRELFEKFKTELQQVDGYIPVEQAAEQALNGLADEGLISQEQADDFYNEAFSAAQLDDNKDYLYDSLGSTVAVTMVNLAIESAEKQIAAIDAGETVATSPSPGSENTGSESTAGGVFEGGDGFLYKPVSENDGNLVIMLPAEMSGDGNSIELQDSEGNVVDQGVWYGDYEDGRPIFRFSSTGSDYPDNLTVNVKLGSGESKEYFIPDASERWS